jgi:hypothetical protein
MNIYCNIEREQESIDQKANELEKKLRAVMGGNVIENESETEDQLMAQWFTLGKLKNIKNFILI